MQAKLFLLHALSPLHAGTGQGVGVIDLPIAREKATGIPFVPGSTVKGVLRDACPDDKKVAVFGPETENAADFAGSVQFTDQRLLLLPVRSLAGTFAWVTSPLLLQRFLRDVGEVANLKAPTLPSAPAKEGCLVADPDCELLLQGKVVLEELKLTPKKDAGVTALAGWLGCHLFPTKNGADPNTFWQEALKKRFCIVSDDVLGFLLQTATEITARITLDDERKTVKKGQLWYEEALPAETVLAGLVLAAPTSKSGATEKTIFDTVSQLTKGQTVQIGGNATVGRGLSRFITVGG